METGRATWLSKSSLTRTVDKEAFAKALLHHEQGGDLMEEGEEAEGEGEDNVQNDDALGGSSFEELKVKLCCFLVCF